MPTYEYVCTSCHNAWEEIQKISENPIEECPKCHKKTAQRQISGGNFILKGGGWYADLYSSSSGSKKADKDANGSSSSSSDTKSESKTETKPEAKAEPKKESAAPPKPAGGSKD